MNIRDREIKEIIAIVDGIRLKLLALTATIISDTIELRDRAKRIRKESNYASY